MTAIFMCDMCIILEKKDRQQVNLKDKKVWDYKDLKAKTGWTAHEGGVHICKECNKVYSMFGKLKETAIVDKIDDVVKNDNNIISQPIPDDEKGEKIAVIITCDVDINGEKCDFEDEEYKVKKHRKAYHYAEMEADDREISVWHCPICIFMDNMKGNVTRHVHATHKEDIKYLSKLHTEERMQRGDYNKLKSNYDKFSIFICREPKCNFLTLDEYVYRNHRRLSHGKKQGRPSKIRVTEEDYKLLLKKQLVKIELDDFVRVIFPVYECDRVRECRQTYARSDRGIEDMIRHMTNEHRFSASEHYDFKESFRTTWKKRKK